jgi:hypothetical protein
MAAALMTYKLWSTTYEDHSMPFEEWIKNNENCAWPYLMDKPLDNNIDLTAEFVRALDTVQQCPSWDQPKKHHLMSIWMDTFITTHTMPFKQWLKDPSKAAYLASAIPETQE